MERVKETPHSDLGGRTPRYAMQTLGTEWGRNTIWGKLWTHRVKTLINLRIQQGFNVVVSDVRFPNEVDLVRELGGVVIGITRPGHVYDTHVSEKLAFEPDFTLVNEQASAGEWCSYFKTALKERGLL